MSEQTITARERDPDRKVYISHRTNLQKPSVISSLWMVEDESTAYLMQEFYKNLNTYDKAQSLKKAQIATRDKYKTLS